MHQAVMVWHTSKVQPMCSPSPMVVKAPTIVRRLPMCPVKVTGCVQRDQPVIKTSKFSAPVARVHPCNKDKKAQLGRMLLSQAGNQAVRAKSLAELGCELEAFKQPKAKVFFGHCETIEVEAHRFKKFEREDIKRDLYRRSPFEAAQEAAWLKEEMIMQEAMVPVFDRKWVESRLVPATAVFHYFQRALNSGGAERPRFVPIFA
eukprot:symbB.v1.2.035145.t2/scaffold4670.1/size36719/4